MKGEDRLSLFAVVPLDPQVVRATNIGDGIFWLWGAFFLVWAGRAQKRPRKILGLNYPLYAYLAAAVSGFYGLFDLTQPF
jgi:hypothetical protein